MKKLSLLTATLLCNISIQANEAIPQESPAINTKHEQKMKWWDDAKFGMFIHWGLYSQCEGYWKGEAISGIGEWILKIGQIPVICLFGR